VLRQLDSYLDAGASPAADRELAAHLSGCPACSAEMELRRQLRDRLRTAAKSVQAPPHLRARIRMAMETPPRRHWLQRVMLPAGALATAVVAVAISYQLGHLRLTQASQDSYVATMAARVSRIMAVGLRDHIHCSVFRKFPKQGMVSDKLFHDAEYRDLAQLVKDKVHRCKDQGCEFVHLSWRGNGALLSLVVSRKGPGESFQADELVPALVSSGLPVYRADVQRFHVAGFETARHLVYMVSDLDREENTRIMLAMSADVRQALDRML
jgi:anti-sigma factor (TIGR02949 family)